jgi:hypothetical protein
LAAPATWTHPIRKGPHALASHGLPWRACPSMPRELRDTAGSSYLMGASAPVTPVTVAAAKKSAPPGTKSEEQSLARSVHRIPCYRVLQNLRGDLHPVMPSTRRYDWLGVGIYFWEYGPFRAWEWARIRFGEAAAVVEATIRLGRCVNLLDIEHHSRFSEAYARAVDQADRVGLTIPENTEDGRHYRDRHLIEFYCRSAADRAGVQFQTVRACYPEGEPLFPGSRLLSRTHVQISVRDSRCIIRLRRITESWNVPVLLPRRSR